MATKKTKEGEMLLELIGGVFLVEKFEDGTERRDEIDGTAVLNALVHILEQALDREEAAVPPEDFEDFEVAEEDEPDTADARLRKKLSGVRMDHVKRKGDRRKK